MSQLFSSPLPNSQPPDLAAQCTPRLLWRLLSAERTRHTPSTHHPSTPSLWRHCSPPPHLLITSSFLSHQATGTQGIESACAAGEDRHRGRTTSSRWHGLTAHSPQPLLSCLRTRSCSPADVPSAIRTPSGTSPRCWTSARPGCSSSSLSAKACAESHPGIPTAQAMATIYANKKILLVL